MIRVYFYNLINPHLHSNTVGMLFLLQKKIYIEKLMYPVYDQGDTYLYDQDAVLSSIIFVRTQIGSGCKSLYVFYRFMKSTGTFTLPNMIGWSLIILIWLGYCFNYKQNTSLYPPPSLLARTHIPILVYMIWVFFIYFM